MPLQLTGQVGPGTSADGTSPPFRQGRSNELVMCELHGRLFEIDVKFIPSEKSALR